MNTRTIYAYSVLIGLLSGVCALVFNAMLSSLSEWTMGGLVHLSVPRPGGEGHRVVPAGGGEAEFHRWLLILLPVIGGLIAGFLIKRFAPEAAGTGTDAYIESFHEKGGRVRGRAAVVKAFATLATIAGGGSAGKEGPTAQIGSGIGSAIGNVLRMGARARRTMLLAGAAGGLGAIFKAPLGGALTAVEVLYKEDLETDALTPCILSSVSAYTVYCSVEGFDHVFSFQERIFHRPVELIVYAILGLLCSAVGYVYVRILHGSQRVFDSLPIHPYLVPPLGGLLVGLIGFFFPPVLGAGLGYIQALLDGDGLGDLGRSATILALAAGLKILTTSFTISSGQSGGVFAPSLFIGGMLGGLVGQVGHNISPDLVPNVTPYIVVGMGAFFAGVANAPIASLIMVSELTGAYELLPPLMIVATISLITSRRYSIYVAQVDNKFDSKAHLWEMSPSWLKKTTIEEAFKGHFNQAAIIPNSLPYPQVLQKARELRQRDFILVDSDGKLTGLVALDDLVLPEELADLGPLVLAQDLANQRPIMVEVSQPLIQVLEKLTDREFDKVPVVDRAGFVLGYIEYRDLLDLYAQGQQVEVALPPV